MSDMWWGTLCFYVFIFTLHLVLWISFAMKACQNEWWTSCPLLHLPRDRDTESGSRFSHVGLHFLSTGAAVNSSESLPPSSSVNDISSMSTDQTLASDTDSSLEASAGPLGCCRWLAACLRNPAFFSRWRDGTHTPAHTDPHTHKRRHAMARTQQGREPKPKLKQTFQPASSSERSIAAKPDAYLTPSCSCFDLLPMMLTTESKSNTIREAFISIKCNFNGCETSDL